MTCFLVRYILSTTVNPLQLSKPRGGGVYTHMILTKHTPHIAPGEKHAAGAMKPLDAGFLAAMRGDGVHFCGFGADHAHARFMVSVDAAATRAEVAVLEVGVGEGALFGGVDGREELVARDVVVQEVGWGDAEVAF